MSGARADVSASAATVSCFAGFIRQIWNHPAGRVQSGGPQAGGDMGRQTVYGGNMPKAT
jgi:hypothetical protein